MSIVAARHWRGSAPRRLSRPGDGDQSRQQENASNVTHPDFAGTAPLVITVLRPWSA